MDVSSKRVFHGRYVKVKLSLCFLTKHHAIKAYWGSGGVCRFMPKSSVSSSNTGSFLLSLLMLRAWEYSAVLIFCKEKVGHLVKAYLHFYRQRVDWIILHRLYNT
jgi:hypothetical protein